MVNPTLHCPCNRRIGETSSTYTSPPPGETAFDLRGQIYRRSYWRCGICRHEFAQHNLDLSGLYDGAYVENTYGDRMRETFDRIVSLPPERSDNERRVSRVTTFASTHFDGGRIPRLLDIGSGLGVFPYAMKRLGWDCTALDPDIRAATHLKEVVGVSTVIGDFFNSRIDDLGLFDVVTLNKVIEHVEDPVTMLARAKTLLKSDGFLYVEVPDVQAAAEGRFREEYFIEHHHVFSAASLSLCGERAGLSLVRTEHFREPSGKYTLAGCFTAVY